LKNKSKSWLAGWHYTFNMNREMSTNYTNVIATISGINIFAISIAL
jgi:hypothetical protein